MPNKQNKNSIQGNGIAVSYSNTDAEICEFFDIASCYI